jgi:hypothetical protein
MKTIKEPTERKNPVLVSIDVSFGPAFFKGKPTNAEFIRHLREEGNRHKSFIGQMMSHFASHLEMAISEGMVNANDIADTDPNTTYYGQGSCTGCPGDNGTGDNCCLCEYNGQHVGCESC